MLRKIINGLDQRKVKVFLLFLLCSFLAWSISKFSDSYESRAKFELQYTRFPDSLLLNDTKTDFIVAKLRASGFKFLNYGIGQKVIKVDLRQVKNKGEEYYLLDNEIKVQLERQLSSTISLLELEKDTFYVDLYKVAVKEIPIKPNLTIEVAPNHLMEGELKLNPRTVTIKGPSNEVSQIKEITTDELILSDLTTNFSQELLLLQPESAENTVLLAKKTLVSGQIKEFSEREFHVPLDSENLPEGYTMKTFPNKITLVCKASVEALKNMGPLDFKVAVDYDSLTTPSTKFLNVRLVESPDSAYAIRLLTYRVEFVLEKL